MDIGRDETLVLLLFVDILHGQCCHELIGISYHKDPSNLPTIGRLECVLVVKPSFQSVGLFRPLRDITIEL